MLKLCANISWLFRELPFLGRAEAARRAGFSGIEFHASEGHTAAEVARAARDAGVRIVLFNASSGDFLSGGPGLSGVPGLESQFREAVLQAREFGAAFGGAYVQIGQSRVPQGISREACQRVYVENLQYAAAQLAHADCKPLVEPMNLKDFPGVLVHDVPTALAAIEAADDPRLGLQFDVYHQYMSGADICGEIDTLGARIAHLQFSDAPGRQEPGTGGIDFAGIFRTLGRQNYGNWLAAEYRPSGSTLQSLAWLRMLLRRGRG